MNPFKYACEFIRSLKASALATVRIQQTLHSLRRDIFWNNFTASERFNDPKRLFKTSFKVFSEANEDGAISEIFRRVGTESRFFVEIGVGDGLECNTAFLLMQGWSGVWFECSQPSVQQGRLNFHEYPVRIIHQTLTPENVDSEIRAACGDNSVDLLSIDIDSYDYYLWKTITCIRPRVIVVEYNASFPPPISKTIAYDASYQPRVGTLYFGATLDAFVKLGATKGYSLVGCSVSGVNAFFVRDDLLGDHFHSPYTADNHYEPPRYGLIGQVGHSAAMGRWLDIS